MVGAAEPALILTFPGYGNTRTTSDLGGRTVALAFSGLPQKPAPDEHQGSPDKKAKVPENPHILRDGFIYVVNAKQLVVHNAFSQIENAEDHQQRPDEQLAGPPHVSSMSGPPQQGESDDDENVSGSVENTIEKRI